MKNEISKSGTQINTFMLTPTVASLPKTVGKPCEASTTSHQITIAFLNATTLKVPKGRHKKTTSSGGGFFGEGW